MRPTSIWRTAVVAVLLLAAPLAVGAQQPGAVHRLGFLLPGASGAAATQVLLDAFRNGLRELGWIEGQNVTIEYRFAEGKQDLLPELAAELVRLRVELIVAEGTPAVRAAKNLTATIPIVMTTVSDPVRSGFAASFARPGGNVTGLTLLVEELNAKRLALLKELMPGISRVAVLWNAANPGNALSLEQTRGAARSLVHCPINSGPTLGDISWVAWENRKGIGKRDGDGPNPKQRSD
jgi:putative ABC transport system substrate-binding protein